MEASTLRRLLSILIGFRELWQVRTFDCAHIPWANGYPALAQAVRALDQTRIDALERNHRVLVATLLPALRTDSTRLDALQPKRPILAASDLLPELPTRSAPPLLPDRVGRCQAGIKARKWEQIQGFLAGLPIGPHDRVLEWCAGLGHLGRLLAKAHGATVTSVDWDANLCRKGHARATALNLPQHFVCSDALGDACHLIPGHNHVLALHACGDLHRRLLELVSQERVRHITVAPCCYHKIRSEHHRFLSLTAQVSAGQDAPLGSPNLTLERADLKLAVAETVTANARDKAWRTTEMRWRLGFDSLQRTIRGIDSSLAVPNLRQSQRSQGFPEFCRWAAAAKGLTLPDNLDFGIWERRGAQRQPLTRRLDLVAQLFRRTLEHTLLLDLTVFLQEQGYTAQLDTFCNPAASPRHARIRASQP